MKADDPSTAAARLDELGAAIVRQEAELRALRARFDHRAGVARPRRGRAWRAAGAAMLVLALGGGAWAVLTRPAPVMTPEPVVVRAEPPPRERAAPRPRGGRDELPKPGFELDLPAEDGVAQLARRCARSSPRTIDDLPEGATLVDFTRCEACGCCREDGTFAGRPFADRHASWRSEKLVDCYRCSRQASFARIGARGRGWFEPRPVRRHGTIIDLERPARMVAVQVTGTIRGTGPRAPEPRHVAVVARDARGRPIDAARIAMETPSGPGPLEPARWPSLRVEACPGEAIARIDLTTDGSTDVARLAVLDAP